MASNNSICWRCASASLHAFRMVKRATNPPQIKRFFSSSRLHLRSDSDPTSSAFPVFQPAFWRFILPKRSRLRPPSSDPARPHWLQNPATHVIALSLLAGSQAIQILTLKRDHLNYSLRTDAHIAKLKDVIGRVQKGEDVDVKKELGTGDEKREREWEEVMKEIAKEDEVFARRRRKREEKARLQEEASKPADQGRNGGRPFEEGGDVENATEPIEPTSSQTISRGGSAGSQVRFY
ncbi:MAG: hypothetical protein M1821_004769 [Bathelium mastoideum]|nr:MAG: hypothetical protein M1821_004769 [Bathelium mastoideum]KAI9692178.1 MAG: hypothetical protein M1822_006408 [Bathelium mastoideum]